MRSGERLVLSVVVAAGLLGSTVYVGVEQLDSSGSGAAAAGSSLGFEAGFGMEGTPWDDPIPEPPDQRGWVSRLAASSSADPLVEDGGLTGGQDPPVPVTPVPPASAQVVLLDDSGGPVDVKEPVAGSPVTLELVSDDGVRVNSVESPSIGVSVVDDGVAAGAGFEKVAFTVTVSGLDATALAEGVSSSESAALLGAVDVVLSVDYSAFVDEFGGNWAGRLRLVRFAPCALTPGVAGCEGPQVVDGFVNDPVNQRITVTVPLEGLVGAGEGLATESTDGQSTSGPSTSGPSSSGSVSGFGLMAGASSSSGDYATTSLNAAGSWAVGSQSGDFTWSYPVVAPAPPAGSAPGVAVSYNSGSIDGLTADENTQGGVLGPGWSMGDGFIERQYRPCGADGGATADFCWFSDNATFSFNGMNAELVRVGTEASGMTGWEAVVYRLEDHTGWIVKRFGRLDQSARGGLGVDNNGEYWVAISPDGTRYLFGYGSEANTSGAPGTVLGSVLTVPVVGNHGGEPCNAQSYNWCHQAYRWSLDRIEDSNGRVTSFHYAQESNFYGVRGTPGFSEPYVAAAPLVRIEYGQLVGSAATPNWYTHSIEFAYHYRCNNPGADLECETAPTSSTGSSFPDIPVDQFCPDSYCENYSPTFFTKYMLQSVTTRVRNTSNVMVEVGRDAFGVEWIDTDGSGNDPPRLWLDSIQHAGTQDGTRSWMPAVQFFEYPARANRVDFNVPGGVTQMLYHRLGSIVDEYGSEIRVDYTLTKPCPNPMPAPGTNGWGGWQNNTWSCFVKWWTPPAGPAGPSAWNKYVVNYVIVVDQSGGVISNSKLYDYQYPDVTATNGGVAWHSDSNEVVPVAQRYWSEFRGFERVRVIVGHQGEANRTMTESTYHRGMDDDINSHSNPDGFAHDDEDTPSTLGSVPDVEQLAGREREVIVRNVVAGNPGPDVYSGAVMSYSAWSTAGTNGVSWQVELYEVRSRAVYGGVATYGRIRNSYDSHPWMRRLIQASDWGRTDLNYVDIDGDDANYDATCTTTSYTPVSAAGGRFLNGLAHRQVLWASASCAGGLIRDVRTFYDGAAVSAVANPAAPPAAPLFGNPTGIWRAAGSFSVWDETVGGYVPAIVERTSYGNNGYQSPQSWGRVQSTADARGYQTTIAYTPFSSTVAAFGAREITVTNTLGHVAKSEFDLFGNQTRSVDPNNRSTYICYDTFGRVTSVYQPGMAGGATCTAKPSLTYSYGFEMVPGNIDAPVPVPRWRIQTRQLFALDADTYNPMLTGDSYLESWTLFDGFGRPAQTNTPSPTGGRIVTRTVYDSQDNPIRVSQPFQTAANVGPAWTVVPYVQVTADTTTTFDAVGRPLDVQQRVTDVVQRTTSTRYLVDRTTMYATTAPGSPSYGQTTNWSNADGQTWQVTEHDNTGTDTNTTYVYDAAGELTYIRDPANNVTLMTYNLLGWRTALDDPDAGHIDTRFYPTGQVRLSVDANNDNLYHRIDALGRTTSTHTSTAYNNANRLAAYTYDGVTGGVGALTASDAFWPAGTLSVHNQITAFDAAGRPATTSTSIPAADNPSVSGDEALAGPHITTTGYTRNGAVYSQTYPGVTGSNLSATETVVMQFNSQGQLNRIGSQTFGYNYTQEINYDPVGRPAQTILGPNINQVDLELLAAWTSDGRLYRQQAFIDPGVPIQDDTYTYDAPGNPTRITHHQAWAGSDETECFQYDGRQRLHRAFTMDDMAVCPAPGETINYSGPAPYYELHEIDTIGRITRLDEQIRSHTANSPAGCRTGTNTTKPHALATATDAGVTTTFSYNCNGAITQQTAAGNTTNYTWDAAQRLQTVTTPAGTTTNTYDTTNNRVLRVDPDGTRTVYLGPTEIRWTTAGVDVARTYGQTRREFDDSLTNFAVNHQGSIVVYTNNTGTNRNTIRYTPYGNNRPTPGNGDNLDDRNFLGQPDDPATPTNYLNNRHYLPTYGAFLSVDPLVLATGDAYLHGAGNPITLTDPSGLSYGCGPNGCLDDYRTIYDQQFTMFKNKSNDYNLTVAETRARGDLFPEQKRTYLNELESAMRHVFELEHYTPPRDPDRPQPVAPDMPPVEEASRLWNEVMTGFDDGADGWGGGVCTSAGVTAAAAGAAGSCLIIDSDGVSAIRSLGGGASVGMPAPSMSVGTMITNADAIELSEWSMCGEVTAGLGTGALCGSIAFNDVTEAWEYSGAWSFYVGVALPGADAGYMYTYSWVDRWFEWPWS